MTMAVAELLEVKILARKFGDNAVLSLFSLLTVVS